MQMQVIKKLTCTIQKNLCKMATLKKTEKLFFKGNYLLMQVKSIAECFIKLPFVIKIFVLSRFYCTLVTINLTFF